MGSMREGLLVRTSICMLLPIETGRSPTKALLGLGSNKKRLGRNTPALLFLPVAFDANLFFVFDFRNQFRDNFFGRELSDCAFFAMLEGGFARFDVFVADDDKVRRAVFFCSADFFAEADVFADDFSADTCGAERGVDFFCVFVVSVTNREDACLHR